MLGGWDGVVPHLPPRSLPGSGWAQAASGGAAGPQDHCRASLFISVYLFTQPAALRPPRFFGRPGVYQPVSKVTLVAGAGPTCNYTASPSDCCWVARVLLFNLFLNQCLPSPVYPHELGGRECETPRAAPHRDAWGCLQKGAASPCQRWAWLCFDNTVLCSVVDRVEKTCRFNPLLKTQ